MRFHMPSSLKPKPEPFESMKAPACQRIRLSAAVPFAEKPVFRLGENTLGRARSMKVMFLLLVRSSSENGSFC